MERISIFFFILIGISISVTLESNNNSLQSKTDHNSESNNSNSDLDLETLKTKGSKELKMEIERMLYSNEDPEKKHEKLQKINKLLEEKILSNMSTPLLELKKPSQRKLIDKVYTRASLAQGNDDISTSLKLKEITQQERAMQNYQKIQNWLSMVKFKVNDLRSNINRRLQDISVGLQRRSLLIGHYNYMGQSMGSPQGQSMSNMNPYFHFR